MSTDRSPREIRTRCCIVGGGPAGMMLGYLLGRAGIDVIVIEKHADFFRDFRGDTIHPSTMDVLHELGILDEFLKLPHQEVAQPLVLINGQPFAGPDFSRLSTRCKFLALIPQWDFLNFMANHAKRFPSFQLLMNTEATDLLWEGDRVTGIIAKTDEGQLRIHAKFVFATDGRHSIVREKAKLELEDFGVPIDVLWFRVGRPKDDEATYLGRVHSGTLLVTLNRGDYYQCGLVIPKGKLEEIHREGLDAFRERIVAAAPLLRETVHEIQNWDQIKLLTVQVNRLKRWSLPGLLCLGDAAHAMSPAGGVGINLAIQDAVATANLLAEKIAQDTCSTEDLALAQKRREPPTRRMQGLQVMIHRNMFGRSDGKPFSPSWPVRKLLAVFAPIIRSYATRVIGLGFLPEHVESKAMSGKGTNG